MNDALSQAAGVADRKAHFLVKPLLSGEYVVFVGSQAEHRIEMLKEPEKQQRFEQGKDDHSCNHVSPQQAPLT